MTDPVQTTQQTSAVVDSAGGPGGIIGAGGLGGGRAWLVY